jgi:hypothetical protein
MVAAEHLRQWCWCNACDGETKGIKDEKEAADLWAYLAQFKPDGSTK